MKYSWEYKLECVENYIAGKPWPEGATGNLKHKISIWKRIFDIHGVEGLKHSNENKNWTAEERYEVVSRVLAGKSINSAAVEAEIDSGQLYQWVKKYKELGYDGLQLRQGRKPKEYSMSPKSKPEKLTKSEREELVLLRKQNEYLQAENAYLKKLRAFIVKKEAEKSVKAKKQELSENSEKKE